MRREVHGDQELGIEVYRFQGMVQAFPSHFHEYYLLGLVEGGERLVTCNNQEWRIGPGDIMNFSPGDVHSCTQVDGGVLDYRGICLEGETVERLMRELTGRASRPVFQPKMIQGDPELGQSLKRLHTLFQSGEKDFGREEELLIAFGQLLERCGRQELSSVPPCRAEIQRVCDYLEEHYSQPIRLEQLCRTAGLSSSALLRAFTRERGITPYRYLEAVRINRARGLLEQGVSQAEAALRTGFSDQSHFGRFFIRLTGVTPGSYQAMFATKRSEPTKE